MASVDRFVFHDDLQYTKGDWRNRNKIKTPQGTVWLTVPVHYRSVSQLICETMIDEATDWRNKHLRQWLSHYRQAPFLTDVLSILGNMCRDEEGLTISRLNVCLVRSIASYLGIATPMSMSSQYKLVGTKTDRLIDLLKKIGATRYLSGPSADAYLDKDAFREAGIGLEYKSYDYEPYPQQWGSFDGAVTVLDLIANCGPGAAEHLRSRTPDKTVI